MNARIDIRTPSGRSLEGFPRDMDTDMGLTLNLGILTATKDGVMICDGVSNKPLANVQLHPGDKIIIEVLP